MSTEPEDAAPRERPPAAADTVDARDTPLRRMPFAWFWPLLVGATAAFVLRIAFSGLPGQRFSAMLGSFIYLAPAVCGAVTVYMAERIERRGWGYYIWAPWVATALFVVGTLVVYIEGMICAIVIVPMFAFMGSLGGLAMGWCAALPTGPGPRSTALQCCRCCSAPSSRSCPTRS